MESWCIDDKKKYQLKIRIKTWNVEANDLYDYKTNKYIEVLDESDENNYFVRKRNNFINKKDNQLDMNFENEEILFRTRKSLKNDNQYEIINPTKKNMKRTQENINNLDNNAWLLIGSNSECCQNENEQYLLNENDIIKLGLKKYEIIEKNINISNDKVTGDECCEISQMNKQKGSIFDINIEKSQYKKIENKNKLKNDEKMEENESTKKKNVLFASMMIQLWKTHYYIYVNVKTGFIINVSNII